MAVAWGVEDPDLGQAVHVAVTYLPQGDAQALGMYCARALAHYMRPRHVYSWDGAMPRTASGKLDRPAIVAAAMAAAPQD